MAAATKKCIFSFKSNTHLPTSATMEVVVAKSKLDKELVHKLKSWLSDIQINDPSNVFSLMSTRRVHLFLQAPPSKPIFIPSYIANTAVFLNCPPYIHAASNPGLLPSLPTVNTIRSPLIITLHISSTSTSSRLALLPFSPFLRCWLIA